MANLIFPLDLQGSSAKQRPLVVFTQNTTKVTANDGAIFNGYVMDDSGNSRIYLPIPQSISVNDKADYGSKSLGLVGKEMSQLMVGTTDAKAIGEKLSNTGKDLKTSGWKGLISTAIQGMSSAGVGGVSAELSSAASIGSGTVFNPYVTTEFTGTETRQFTFNFKLIPTSKDEADLIKQIVSAFRLGVYPKTKNAIQLSYPPTWTIRFIGYTELGALKDIDFLPKIFETYLQDVTTTFNAGGNMWRVGGAPLETDIVLSFTETRALTLDDISKLEAIPYSQGEFDKTITFDKQQQ